MAKEEGEEMSSGLDRYIEEKFFGEGGRVICNKVDKDCNCCDHKKPHERKQTGSEVCTESGYCAQKNTMVRCVPDER